MVRVAFALCHAVMSEVQSNGKSSFCPVSRCDE